MKIYLLLTEDNIVYGYHTRPLELDNVVEFEVEQEAYIQDNIGHLKLDDGNLIELPRVVDDNTYRMNEIQEKLKALDIKTFKFIDGDINQEQYEPYRLEKQALREEYRSLEE